MVPRGKLAQPERRGLRATQVPLALMDLRVLLEMMERLVRALHIIRSQLRRHGLDAFAFAGKQ